MRRCCMSHRQRKDPGVYPADPALPGAGAPGFSPGAGDQPTPQMILRLKSRFGSRVAVQHSALNQHRTAAAMADDPGWRCRYRGGDPQRSVSPLEDLGLIIIDEEQEHTYRSESAPVLGP